MNKVKGTFRVDVVNCPRCGGDHGDLWVKGFEGGGPSGYTHFSVCPEEVQPILLRVLCEGQSTRISFSGGKK